MLTVLPLALHGILFLLALHLLRPGGLGGLPGGFLAGCDLPNLHRQGAWLVLGALAVHVPRRPGGRSGCGSGFGGHHT